LAPAADRLADQPLGGTVAVHLGGVDQGHAEVDAGLQRGDLRRPAGGLFAHHPGPHAKGRNPFAGGQRDVFHRASAPGSPSTSTARKSLTLVSVGPVTTASSRAPKKPWPSLFCKASIGLMPCAQARASVSGASSAPAVSSSPSTPSVSPAMA